MNFAWQNENIKFDYLFAHDDIYFKKIGTDLSILTKKVVNKIFIGKRVAITSDCFVNCAENTSFISNAVRYYLNLTGSEQTIYQDICTHPLANMASVLSPTLHFAIFTYPEKIYLAGCDVSKFGHFYDKISSVSYDLKTANLKVGYARFKMFARQYYPETEIISINPVGLRGLFKDVYTDEYLEALKREKSSES